MAHMTDAAGEHEWHVVGSVGDIDDEDVIRFDHGAATYAVYNTSQGYFATDGMCTHEEAHLADGFVEGDIIECCMHLGRFHIPTGQARDAPVIVDLATYPVKVEGGKIFIGLPWPGSGSGA
jgi:3-phenylpropionate/trans-cinnamate dioxygenase ferredoxin subunit